MTVSRELWARYELVHDVGYFSPRRNEQADALGFRGFWMGYFAFRSAPLGPVDPAVVGATFFGFHPGRVRRALPDAWSYATPAQALTARLAAAEAALADLGAVADDLTEAADLAWEAAQAADPAGRPLGAAEQAQPRPADPRGALWQAATVLREHRGDGHVAALVAHGIGPAEAHLIKAGAGEADGEALRTLRGFPAEEWAAARDGLVSRGLLDSAGQLTAAGRGAHESIEAATDTAAAQPWAVLGPDRTARLRDLLDPVADAILATGLIPAANPVGLSART